MEKGSGKIPPKDLLFSDDTTIRKLPPICPQCGTWNPPEAKFCKKDGVKLPERGKYTGAPLSPHSNAQSGKGAKSAGKPETANMETTAAGIDATRETKDLTEIKAPAKSAGNRAMQAKAAYPQALKNHSSLIIICVVLIAVVVGGFCWYFFVVARGAMQQSLQRKVTVQNEIKPPAAPPEQPQPAAESAPEPAEVPTPTVSPEPETREPARPEKVIDKKPKSKPVRVAPVPVRAVPVKPKQDTTEVAKPKEQHLDPKKVEGKLNQTLRNSGVGSVTAEISENMTATLKGTVHSNKDRSKALSVARGFEGVKSVKDIIFVIEP
jgi:hypothetical protein